MMKKIRFLFSFFFFYTSAFSQNMDIDLLRTINENRTPIWDSIFIFITDSVGWLAYLVPLSLLAFAFLSKSRPAKQKALLIGVSALTAALIVTVLKHTVNEVRPFITYPFITKLSNAGSPSFPSGHTSDAFVLATALSIGYPKWYLILPVYLWALAVAYSRMYLGVHYPIDVLAGALTGSCTAVGWYFINRWYLKKRRTSSDITVSAD